MRKLASIQRIKSLAPIEGADMIERATVLGWQLVVKKDEFRVGDLVVYCEIDSLMPDKSEFEFLRKNGMRIRTVRLRGQISQGICFPLSVLPDGFTVEENADCTDALGVVKYEPPIPACLGGAAKGSFPAFVPKTDETRVQVLQGLLNKYVGTTCYIAEKVDGSSITLYLQNGEFGVCSRNLEMKESSNNAFWQAAKALDIEVKLRRLGRNLAIQGELFGCDVQGNSLKQKGRTVKFFNAFDIDKYEYLSFQELKDVLRELDLSLVPIVEESYVLETDIEALVKKATIRSSINSSVWAEGIVIRPHKETFDSEFNCRVSFKAINPEFLLKHGG